jgi:hypothetical protein
MIVHELIELLAEVKDQDAEVRIGHQPTYPLQFEITGIAVPAEDMVGEQVLDEDGEIPQAVYILDDEHPEGENPYIPKVLWETGRS